MVDQGDLESIAEFEAMPQLPPLGAHVWGWFCDLHATRSSGGMGGPSRLTRLEIRTWEEDEGRALSAWERRLILDIDAAWQAAFSADLNQTREGAKDHG